MHKKWNPRRIGAGKGFGDASNRVGVLPEGLPLVREFKCFVVGCQSQATDGHHFSYLEIESKPWLHRIPLCKSHHMQISRREGRMGLLEATMLITERTAKELSEIAKTLVTPKLAVELIYGKGMYHIK
jgi:hypothetical protein